MAVHNSIISCVQCGTQIAPGILSCPACKQLLYTDTLKRLAQEAETAARAADRQAELRTWREALDHLPADSRQHQVILAKVNELSRAVEADGAPAQKPGIPGAAPAGERKRWPKWLLALGPIGLLLWKFKFVVVFLLTKGKLLLLGLTKGSTFFSMLLSLGVYWAAWGWKFALGFVLSIYIHEMGHVAMLNRYGIKATAPMFIPGFGALIRLKQYPATPREDARVGLAGPLWGLGAALASYATYRLSGQAIWAAIAQVGAWINLFNLLPVWQLDGSRGFRALARWQRWVVVLTMLGMWFVTSGWLMLLLALFGTLRVFKGDDAPAEPDYVAWLQFLLLVVVLAIMSQIQVPGMGRAWGQ